MHNDGGYHQEVMHVQRTANRRDRVAWLGMDRSRIGTSIENPDVDYAGLAKSTGYWSASTIKDPSELGPALKRAVEVVKSGQPALLKGGNIGKVVRGRIEPFRRRFDQRSAPAGRKAFRPQEGLRHSRRPVLVYANLQYVC